ncbi:MAG: branched-chain amino acid ABC transporter permease, partial [Gemmatimonadetes bacterium]|nr:branched-chain amino acid ABC transporter permease [Gemmatimonadota bacterium]
MDDYVVSILSNIGMISFLALSAYLLLLTGEISFGQQAFFAISAYLSGIATAMWGWPLWSGLLLGALAAAAAATVIGVLTLRLRGLYFSIATLAFAEMVRLLFVIFHYQVVIDGEPVGPDGAEGFRDIRWVFENNISVTEYMVIIYTVLVIVLTLFFLLERSRLGSIFRMLGEDTLLTEMQGLNVIRFKVLASGIAGFIAGIGGGFYAHFATYLEPQNFSVMLGVHALVYGLIGGLGTALGPLIGVGLDIGFLEAIRAIQGYRMIVFGGLVAVLLIFMPRGILDEERIHWFRLTWRRWRDA